MVWDWEFEQDNEDEINNGAQMKYFPRNWGEPDMVNYMQDIVTGQGEQIEVEGILMPVDKTDVDWNSGWGMI